MSAPPRIDALLRRALPEEFADDLVGDLREGYRRRRGERGRLAAGAWWLREAATIPYPAVWRQARRLRARGVRREMSLGRGGGLVAGLEVGVAARALIRRPAYAAVAVLTLATSVGAGTLVFSVMEGVLLRPLPYPSGERLYRVWGTNQAWREAEEELFRKAWDRQNVSMAMVSGWRASAPAVEAASGWAEGTVLWDDGGPPAEHPGAWILPGLFTTLEVEPVLGRLPGDQEVEDGDPVLVLSERLWTSRFGRDPGVLGRTVVLDGRSTTVVGVVDAALALPSERTGWWSPLPEAYRDDLDRAVFSAVVRLAPGADPESAREQLDAAAAALAAAGGPYDGIGTRIVPLRDEVVGNVRGGITYLFWGMVLVTLIACVNLASLVVARTARRRGELAMRAALGAGRRTLVGAMLGETLLICLAGGGLGVLLGAALIGPLVDFLAASVPGFPRAGNVELNLRVLGFALAITAGTALLAGGVPSWVASDRSPWEALQEGRRSRGGRGVRRTQAMLLVVESVLAMMLLVGAGLLARTSLHLAKMDPGYDAGVAFVRVRPSEDRYPSVREAQALGAEVAERIGSLPGTVTVARASALPGLGGTGLTLVWGSGDPPESAGSVGSVAVDGEYFEALDIPLRAGRTFGPGDGPDGEPVVIVGELLARRLFGDADPVGRSLMLGTGTRMEGGGLVADEGEPARVVGVVGDVHQLSVVLEAGPVLYRPMGQGGGRMQAIVARTAGDPAALLDAVRAEAQAVDAGLLVDDPGVLRRESMRVMAPITVRTVLGVTMAALAAFLTLVGIYGVVAYVVSDRVHEIGVRMALGARPKGEAARIMVGVGLRPVALGGLLGLCGAAALSRLLEESLFGVEPLDPLTYVAVALLLPALAALSAWLPARRAAAVDPMRILNDE